jgi:hypothetical protein
VATYSNAPPDESDRLPNDCIDGVVLEPSELSMQDSQGPWQAQQSLERAAINGGGVELEGKSASIKSISDSIHSSNASSFSSCFVLCSERSICISTTGSRRQLSIRKKERKGDSDEPDAPLLLEWELAVGEGDVVIGRKKRDQANDSANR